MKKLIEKIEMNYNPNPEWNDEKLWWREECEHENSLFDSFEYPPPPLTPSPLTHSPEPIEETNDMTEDVQIVASCRSIMTSIPITQQNKQYQELYQNMTEYLATFCIHDFVEDYIDITPDYGCNITYCNKCGIDKK